MQIKHNLFKENKQLNTQHQRNIKKIISSLTQILIEKSGVTRRNTFPDYSGQNSSRTAKSVTLTPEIAALTLRGTR